MTLVDPMSNVYFDTAASPFLYRDVIFEHIAAIIGADKILFGSDHPLIAQNRIIKSIYSLNLTEEEKADVVSTEMLNGFFVLGRSIGIMGHIFDQKRQRAALYRQPWDEILFAD